LKIKKGFKEEEDEDYLLRQHQVMRRVFNEPTPKVR
jgi:hypothetical protein